MTEKIERWEAKVKTDLAVVILKNLDNEIFTETVDQVFDFIRQTLQKQAEDLVKQYSEQADKEIKERLQMQAEEIIADIPMNLSMAHDAVWKLTEQLKLKYLP